MSGRDHHSWLLHPIHTDVVHIGYLSVDICSYRKYQLLLLLPLLLLTADLDLVLV
jgi:hypothetical protein